jgi:hypothetical protein
VRRRTVLLLLAVWLAAAINIGRSGLLGRLPIPPPAIAVGLTILLLLLIRVSRVARAAAWTLGPRSLVGFHAVRIAAGAYFLTLYNRGELPAAFAVPAGWGDIAVGVAALVVVAVCLPVRTRAQRIGLLAWNAAGLIDILAVLANGARMFLGDPALAAPFITLPLALLPTFVVPLVIVSHVLLFQAARDPAAMRSVRPR